ncbi:MAG: presqualene diphosphate synthase HpnD [Melioribacteraceae bacterium]|nr:presqualene diphosphate synthase HpnD [Melioribacteraceae bacterium]MCF8265714.1 presqualene diphosphate synthase HpnD [Melioribacteraceae bacterium]MCF8412467.1 presqualene diphosphate synthase HpnD [Melioribacteraceae bacterium]
MNDQAKEIAKNSKSSFYYAFSLLPPDKRDAMNTVYAFCRKTDDIVDDGLEPNDIKYENLHKWRLELERSIYGKSDYILFNKLSGAIKQFNIPIDPFFDLIRGMEMDLQKNRYLKFEDLVEYCYRVASTVGLMCIEIFGYKHKSAHDFAVNLGLALQLTNIIRDVKVDADNDRIYLPQEDLEKFGYSEKDIFENTYNQNFQDLMKHESLRAKRFFVKANSSLDFEDKPAMFAARAMQHIYYKLLKRIEYENYNVYEQKIRVPTLEKAAISIGVWAKYSLVY